MSDPPDSELSRGELFDLDQISPMPLRERSNLVAREQFRPLVSPHGTIRELVDSLPDLLAGREFRRAVERTAAAVMKGRPVLAACGGHVVKVGMGRLFADLLRRKVITGLVMNGATAIHDLEIALIGETSEDVKTNLADGSFGMARETAEAFREAAARSRSGVGLGRALGESLVEAGAKFQADSMLATAAQLGIPVTVHVAVGTDIVHMHPGTDGADVGRASYIDFLRLARLMEDFEEGVWLNVGSAVVLPEVFLKVVNMARNVGHKLGGLTAINFDMLQHYRTSVNVISRPVEVGISLIGHHEINLPLFRAALLGDLERQGFQQEGC